VRLLVVGIVGMLALRSIPSAEGYARAPQGEGDVVLRFGGDVLLGGAYEESVGDSVSLAFSDFPGLATADIAMVNLENPVTTRGSRVRKPYNFRMHPRFLRAITDAGIDVVTIANNHIFDFGKEGLFDTISYLDSVGVKHVGAGRDAAEAYRPVVLNVRGRTIGFLAYYGGGEAPGATKRSCGVARRDLRRIAAEIAALKDNVKAVYIVVNLHWGTEKARLPDDDQRAFARALIDAGADAVIGHHPHVLQGIERYHGGVIAYSLGNLLFGGNSRSTYRTGLFEIRLGKEASRYSFLPVGVEHWHARMLTGADSLGVMTDVAHLSSMFPQSIFPK
jgi:poly-gamma-glutamate capsule biosynthesis protein CapA/YwtB (metallophosphatase superfamily)